MPRVPRKSLVFGEDDEDDTIAFAHKRFHQDQFIDSKRPHPNLDDICSTTDTIRVLLRRALFLNEEKGRYLSVGFYAEDKYQVLAEFGGPRIAPITLTEQHVKSLVEHLPALREAMYRCEHYTSKDRPSLLQSGGANATARIYRDKKCVSFNLADLCYMLTMLPFVQVQQTQYILAQNDVMTFAIAALG